MNRGGKPAKIALGLLELTVPRGHLWAIQAKAYDAATWITKRDVDTFLAESGRSEFSFRLLIATTNLIGRTAKRTIDAQEKQASVLLLGDLEAAEVDWPASPPICVPGGCRRNAPGLISAKR